MAIAWHGSQFGESLTRKMRAGKKNRSITPDVEFKSTGVRAEIEKRPRVRCYIGAPRNSLGTPDSSNEVPSGKGPDIFLEQMDKAHHQAAVMKKLKQGWSQFGFDDPWWVVHDVPKKQLARYNSEP